MNIWLALAGSLAALTGVVHSVMGERLIFRALRDGGLIPSKEAPPLRRAHLRILWATWHIATVLGLALAGLLWWMALRAAGAEWAGAVAALIAAAYAASGLLVLLGTRGRHPGWVALLAVGLLSWLGAGEGLR